MGEIEPHLYALVIGTCVPDAVLRQLLEDVVPVEVLTVADLGTEAVRLCRLNASLRRRVTTRLDEYHAAMIERCAPLDGVGELERLWRACRAPALRAGAYWAVLTHRDATAGLRQAVSDELMVWQAQGAAAAGPAPVELPAAESSREALQHLTDLQRRRLRALASERDQLLREQGELRDQMMDALWGAGLDGGLAVPLETALEAQERRRAQRERRPRGTGRPVGEAVDAERMQRYADAVTRELDAAEALLRIGAGAAGPRVRWDLALSGRRVLYVGGRPSALESIAAIVTRHGGELRRGDGGSTVAAGGLSGLLEWADLVVFPCDCVDAAPADELRRLCLRLALPLAPLRTSGVASFAAAIATLCASAADGVDGGEGAATRCRRHG